MYRCRLLVVLLLGVAFSGCASPGALQHDDDLDQKFRFEWFMPEGTTDILAYLVVDIGDGTECEIKRGARGNFGHESKLGGYMNEKVGNSTFYGSVRFHYPTFHSGSVNTVPVTNQVHEELPGSYGWGLANYWKSMNSTEYRGVFGFLDMRTDPGDPLFAVVCDSQDVSVRFYATHHFEPIYTDTADGGHGASLPILLPAQPVAVRLNHADRYEIDADGDLVLLDLWDSGFGQNGRYVRSTLSLETPAGLEEFSYQLENDYWFYQGLWEETGSYGLEIDRIGLNQGPLIGVFGSLQLLFEKSKPAEILS